MASSSNQRKSKRIDCRVPIDCKAGAPFDQSKAVDISKGGVGVLVKKAVPVDTTMAVEIALTPTSEPIIAFGQVRWVTELPTNDGYRLGLNFIDVTPTSRSRLNKYFRA